MEVSTEKDICRVCQEPEFASRFAEKISGDPNNNLVHSLVERANRKEISNERFFGELIETFGEDKVAYATLEVLRGKGTGTPSPTLQQAPPAQPPTPPAQPPVLQSPQSPAPQPPQPPAPAPAQAEEEEEEGEEKEEEKEKKKWRSEKKGTCAACVASPLLGMLLVFEDWFLDEDKKFIQELEKQLEHGTKSVEDVFTDIFLKFGQPGVDGLNRIVRDINVTIEEAKARALKEKPELAELTWD